MVESKITVLVDTAEDQPWTFQGIHADADKGGDEIHVPWVYTCLGRWPSSLGDYSVDGLFGQVAIERKSVEDCWGTVLGWENERSRTGRRKRFEQELANLATLPGPKGHGNGACVIVEGTLDHCLEHMPAWGTKTVETNRKIFYRSVISYQQDYVPWLFCPGRRAAEITAYRWLERFWRKRREAQKQC